MHLKHIGGTDTAASVSADEPAVTRYLFRDTRNYLRYCTCTQVYLLQLTNTRSRLMC